MVLNIIGLGLADEKDITVKYCQYTLLALLLKTQCMSVYIVSNVYIFITIGL